MAFLQQPDLTGGNLRTVRFSCERDGRFAPHLCLLHMDTHVLAMLCTHLCSRSGLRIWRFTIFCKASIRLPVCFERWIQTAVLDCACMRTCRCQACAHAACMPPLTQRLLCVTWVFSYTVLMPVPCPCMHALANFDNRYPHCLPTWTRCSRTHASAPSCCSRRSGTFGPQQQFFHWQHRRRDPLADALRAEGSQISRRVTLPQTSTPVADSMGGVEGFAPSRLLCCLHG